MRRRVPEVPLQDVDLNEAWNESHACTDPVWLAMRASSSAWAEAERLDFEAFSGRVAEEVAREAASKAVEVEARAWLAWPGRIDWLRGRSQS